MQFKIIRIQNKIFPIHQIYQIKRLTITSMNEDINKEIGSYPTGRNVSKYNHLGGIYLRPTICQV